MAIQWDQWREKYITGSDEVTLKFLSEQPGSPSLISFKKRAAEEKWTDKRREYRIIQLTGVLAPPPKKEPPPPPSKPSIASRDSPESRRAISAAAEKVIRFSKMLDDRARVAHQLMMVAARQAMRIGPENWTARDCAQFYQMGARVQKESLDAAIQLIDLGIFSREELQAIAEGSDRPKPETIEID